MAQYSLGAKNEGGDPFLVQQDRFPPSAVNTGFKQHSFFFLLQHRFLPCENKSKAVERVKDDFNKVSLGGGKEGACPVTSVHSPKRRRRVGAILHLKCGNPANDVTSSAS